MKNTYVVLDTNQLQQDWMGTGFRSMLLANRAAYNFLTVVVPRVVVEELVANHRRALQAATESNLKSARSLARLGHKLPDLTVREFDYREYILERFDEVLGFDVLDWPKVSHQELVARSTNRTPPFNQNGGGYRDSLVWASVLELASAGHPVVLVSADAAFSAQDGQLHHELSAEVEALGVPVTLVSDLTKWLLSLLPNASTVIDAIHTVRDEEFSEYYTSSDMSYEIEPTAADIGFDRRPIRFEIDETYLAGDIRRISEAVAGDGATVVEYDIEQVVHFRTVLPDIAVLNDDWEVESRVGDELTVTGAVDMVVRIAVLFDSERSFSVEEVRWSRADGTPRGQDVAEPNPLQQKLF